MAAVTVPSDLHYPAVCCHFCFWLKYLYFVSLGPFRGTSPCLCLCFLFAPIRPQGLVGWAHWCGANQQWPTWHRRPYISVSAPRSRITPDSSPVMLTVFNAHDDNSGSSAHTSLCFTQKSSGNWKSPGDCVRACERATEAMLTGRLAFIMFWCGTVCPVLLLYEAKNNIEWHSEGLCLSQKCRLHTSVFQCFNIHISFMKQNDTCL